jgi:hypothetical protein
MERAMSPNTVASYCSDVARFAQFHQAPLEKADSESVVNYLSSRRDISERTQAHILSSLRNFYDWLLLEKVVDGTTVSLSDVTSWKFTEVDINQILGTNQVSGNLYILPIAYDKAGNNNISKTAELKYNSPVSDADVTAAEIDLHSDRPIIKFTNLSWDPSANSYFKYINATTLNASIEDDDGISEVRVAINVYDILNHDTVVITKDAVKAIEEVYA